MGPIVPCPGPNSHSGRFRTRQRVALSLMRGARYGGPTPDTGGFMDLEYEVLDSPIDGLLAVASPSGLVALEFDGARRLAAARKRLAHLDATFVPAPRRGGAMAPVREWVKAYFAGDALESRALSYRPFCTQFPVAV